MDKKLIHAVANKVSSFLVDSYNGQSHLSTSHLSGSGPVLEFEDKLKSWYKKKYAVLMSSCTFAIYSVAKALQLNEKEIIVPTLSWGGSVSGLLELSMKLRFADISLNSACIDPDSIRKQITPETGAILSVDLLGNSADHAEISQIADGADIPYIADCAQSLGVVTDGTASGFEADVIVGSISAPKAISGLEGGFIVTDDEEFYKTVISNTQHQYRQIFDTGKTNVFFFNGRINPIAAVLANSIFDEYMRT